MTLSTKHRGQSLCLLNIENLDSKFQPWLKISDTKFHPDVCALYCNSNLNPIQSIEINYLPPLISYLWPLAYQGDNIWAVDYPTIRDGASVPFVLKYDLLIWDTFYRLTSSRSSLNGDIIYPKILILAPDWRTCESTYKHLSNVNTGILNKIIISCVYEGQNVESELYKKLLNEGCDLLIVTPTIINDLIHKRHIHFEQLQMIVYDQIDLLLQTDQSIEDMIELIQLHKKKENLPQNLFLSRVVNQQTKRFIESQNSHHYYLSSSMMETYSYKNFFIYSEPCRDWFERKQIIKDTFDLASNHRKKVVMCAQQMRRLVTMQSILNDLSIQSTLIHSQLNSDEIDQYIDEWQKLNDRTFILLIQDDILNEISIDNTDIIIHLDVQRTFWYQSFNQRMKLIYKHLLDTSLHDEINKFELTTLKSIENFYCLNITLNIPLVIILWPGDCAHVTYELIDFIKNSNSYLHPLIERLAKNNCHESIQSKLNVEFCPTLKSFGQCLNKNKLKRCSYRHYFHYDVDCIEENHNKMNENYLSDSYELCLPTQGEIELRITHISDGNRLWANILRSRNDSNQSLIKLFDYDLFNKQIQDGFNSVKNRPLSEVIPGEIYFYSDESNNIHRVYVHDQEENYYDIRRADSILNRMLRVTKMKSNDETKQSNIRSEENVCISIVDRPALTVFSLDTGVTFTLKSNENLYPIEPLSLKQYPPLAIEIILCNIQPLDKITMTYTPFTIDKLRCLTLNEIFMARIKLATRSCFWIDPLVKPIHLTALKRIAYDKPIRTQLISLKLVQPNDNHMNSIETLANEANLMSVSKSVQEKSTEQVLSVEDSAEKDEITQNFSSEFKPFVNRLGQIIINPVGRSKELFSKQNQEISIDDKLNSNEQLINQNCNQNIPIGRGRGIINSKLPTIRNTLNRPQTISISKNEKFEQINDQILINQQEISINSNVTTPSEIGSNKMEELEKKTEYINNLKENQVSQEITDSNLSIQSNTVSSKVNDNTQNNNPTDNDQMMFIFGPKLFSQLQQIKQMEDEQRRQADFCVQRNRNRYTRNNNSTKANNQEYNRNADENNEKLKPNMSRYEPFVDERGPLTKEQIVYKQTQRKTRLFWEQTSRDIYLTIGFYNVDSTQTRVEFETNLIYCRTKIRSFERFVRIRLLNEILPDKCSFQVRRSNILLTMRKANEKQTWPALTDQPIEPQPDFFTVEYGSDDESDTDKRRHNVSHQWQRIREEKRKTKEHTMDEKYCLDDIDDDDDQHQLDNPKHDDEQDEHDITDTSSDCHTPDSDDCYYEDQVPSNHIPAGYNDADYDHRFYGQNIRS